MPLDWYVAIAFMREFRAQTALTVAAVGVGVAVMVFLSALITGLQDRLVDQTLGTQAHVVLRPPEEVARPQLWPDDTAVARRVEKPPQRMRSIVDWPKVDRGLDDDPAVVASTPVAYGDAFAVRGSVNKPVVLLGVEPARLDKVIAIAPSMIAGGLDLDGREAVIGRELASDLGVGLRDKLRVEIPGGRAEIFTIGGIFDLGVKQVNERWVVIPLRAGQSLLDLPGGTNAIYLRVDRIFEAEEVARRLADRTGLVAESWMETNAQLLIALRSQSSSSYTIQFFVFVAVAMGIASLLVISVVQRSREIGILRAMGVPRSAIARVFVIQGALVGLGGSLVGVGLGAAMSLAFSRLVQNPDGSPTFPVALTPALFAAAAALATVTGVAAAVLPARRAARLDPVEALRRV